MKKTKILRIIARLNIGGPAIHVILLTAGLEREKFESRLLFGKVSPGEGDMSYYAEEKGIEPYFIRGLKRELNLFDDLLALWEIYKVILVYRPDIIHTHTAKAGALGRSAGLIYNLLHPGKKIKLIHTFHGHIFEGYFSKTKSRFFIFIERVLAIFSSAVITVSQTLKSELIESGVAKAGKIRVIPLGFELDPFLKIPPKGPGETFNIGIIGRLTAVKNHRLFLEAAKELASLKTQKKLNFFIIGDGELRQDLEKYSRQLDLSETVKFTGWQKNLVNVYADLDLVVLTSLNEGTPVSLIEAMAAARPIVSTNAGGVKDLLGKPAYTSGIPAQKGYRILERGVIIEEFLAQPLAQAILLLLQNTLIREKICANSREFTKKQFSKERLYKDIELLYQTLVPA